MKIIGDTIRVEGWRLVREIFRPRQLRAGLGMFRFRTSPPYGEDYPPYFD